LKSRRTALAGGAALVLGGMAAATVKAQQTPDAVPGVSEDVLVFGAGGAVEFEEKLGQRREAWLKAVATKLGTTPEKLDQALQDVAKEEGLPPPLMIPFPKPPFGEPGEPGTFSIKIDSDFSAAAKAIGITQEQLRKESVGKSLSDVARAHDVEPKVVADALKAQRLINIDQAVAARKLPSTFAERLKSRLDDEIDHLMEMKGVGGRNMVFRFERSGR
jgi:hypothetical protein